MNTKNLKINIYELENECSTQPELFANAGLEYVKLRYAANEARAVKELKEAKIGADIRANPSKYGLAKITEAAILEALKQNDHIVKAVKKCIDAEKAAEEARAIRDAYSQRSSLLKAEVDLFISNYYSDATNSSTLKEAEKKLRGSGRK